MLPSSGCARLASCDLWFQSLTVGGSRFSKAVKVSAVVLALVGPRWFDQSLYLYVWLPVWPDVARGYWLVLGVTALCAFQIGSSGTRPPPNLDRASAGVRRGCKGSRRVRSPVRSSEGGISNRCGMK